MKMEQIECSETSAYKIKRPGNHPEENIQHTEHGESLKSKIIYFILTEFLYHYDTECLLKCKIYSKFKLRKYALNGATSVVKRVI
jgi:hypothetical protein